MGSDNQTSSKRLERGNNALIFQKLRKSQASICQPTLAVILYAASA